MLGIGQFWLGAVGLAAYLVWRYGLGRAWFTLLALGVAFYGGVWRFQHSFPDLGGLPYEQTIAFTAMVVKPIQVKSEQQRITVHAVDWPGNILLTVPLYPQYNYGDVLEVQCRLQAPKANAEFDYSKYLARYHVYALCNRPQLQLVGHTSHWLFSPLYAVRTAVQRQVRTLWPEPVSSLIQGVLLGLQDDIPVDINDLFRRTGTIHVLVVSGMHVMLLAQLLERSTKRWLSVRTRFVLLCAALLAFCVITGLAASVIRASLMGLIIPVAQLVGRPRRAHITLALVAAIMSAINPYVLLNDLGFQLSFLATLGLIYFQPLTERVCSWLPTWFSLRETLATSLAATIPTAPLIATQFGTFSPVSFFANCIVLPVSNLLLFAGAAITATSWVWPSLARLHAFVLWQVTWWMLRAQSWLSALPGAYVENVSVAHNSALVMYLLIFTYIVWRSERPLFSASY
jgi:competence protein ComEC